MIPLGQMDMYVLAYMILYHMINGCDHASKWLEITILINGHQLPVSYFRVRLFWSLIFMVDEI